MIHVSQKDIDCIKHLYETEGFTASAIAVKLNIPASKIYAIIKGHKFTKRKLPNFSVTDLLNIKKLYVEEYHTAREIAKMYNVSHWLIYKVLKYLNIPLTIKKPRKYTEEDIAKFVSVYEEGYSAACISGNCDISIPHLLHLVRKHGKKVRNSGSRSKTIRKRNKKIQEENEYELRVMEHYIPYEQTRKELSEKTNLPAWTVYKLAKQLNLKFKQCQLSQAKLNELKTEYEKGWPTSSNEALTVQELAKKYKIGVSTIIIYAKKFGWKQRCNTSKRACNG